MTSPGVTALLNWIKKQARKDGCRCEPSPAIQLRWVLATKPGDKDTAYGWVKHNGQKCRYAHDGGMTLYQLHQDPGARPDPEFIS